MLRQQQLLEPPPARRLIVPKGHAAWYGVDTSVSRIAIGWADGSCRRGQVTFPLPSLAGGERLAHAFAVVRDGVAERIAAGRLPLPGLIMVEQPSGKSLNLQLAYMVGVVQAAVFEGAVLGGASAPRVETVTSSWWKKRACGNGAIYKPRRGDTHEYGVLTWARANGYTGCSYDEADALAMAEAGRREVALEER